jgi:hypothetical protein
LFIDLHLVWNEQDKNLPKQGGLKKKKFNLLWTHILPCAIEVHLIIGYTKPHTQIGSLILQRNLNFIPNNSIYNNKHMCINTIRQVQKWKISGGNAQQSRYWLWEMINHCLTQWGKWVNEICWHTRILKPCDEYKTLSLHGLTFKNPIVCYLI